MADARLRIAAVQFDSVVGDVRGNRARLTSAALEASRAGASLCVTPELSLLGYPPRDLLLREGLADACMNAAMRLARDLADRGAGAMATLVGLPIRGPQGSRPLINAVAVLRSGVVESLHGKQLLPSYDVFDETRYFAPGDASSPITVGETRVGIVICEDLWQGEDVGKGGGYGVDPLARARSQGCAIVVAPSASPFFVGKHASRLDLLRRRARVAGIPLLSVNAAGANDDFVFDGGSCLIGPEGTEAHALRFREEVMLCELGRAGPAETVMSSDEELARAAISAIAGYVRKSGHQRVLVGLSGGIDSAVVAALAVAALGPENVRGLSMPGPFSSRGSIEEALESARRLGMRVPDSLPISDAYSQMKCGLAPNAAIEGLSDENLQSRLRGLTLMTLSNATGALVLSTGNKSELAVGYATLYGDMCGGIAPLGDFLKGQVYSVAEWLNANHARVGLGRPPIPLASITKAPSAELRPNQTDQDSLPPYSDLDRIVSMFIDDERSPKSIARETGLDIAVITRWTDAIDRAHYKRFQAPIIPKVSTRAFGPGRRLPLAMRYQLDEG